MTDRLPIIIMGANGGIGAALAKKLLEQNELLILTARDTTTLSDFNNSDRVSTYTLDVTQPESDEFQAFIEHVKQSGIKGLAYCIGSIDLKPLKATKDEDFLLSYELNVLGVLRVLRALEKPLKTQNSSIVLFSSIAVQQGFSNHTVISTAKGAVEGLTRALAAEWAPQVRVNCIAPSLTDTALAKSLTSSPQMASAIAAMHPIPRLGKAEDSAGLAAMLLNDQAAWITGQVIHVDGGRSTVRVKG